MISYLLIEEDGSMIVSHELQDSDFSEAEAGFLDIVKLETQERYNASDDKWEFIEII